MPSPTHVEVHQNRPLSEYSLAFRQSADNFVAGRLFGRVQVQKRSDTFYTYPREQWFKSYMESRAPGAPAATAEYRITTDSYQCNRFAVAKDIPDPIRANADDPIRLDFEAVEYLTQQRLLKEDKEFVSAFWSTSAWNQVGTLGNGLWSAGSTSTPIEDVRATKRVMHRNTGLMPNKMALGAEVFDSLMEHPDIIARVDRGQTPGGPAKSDLGILASLFGVDEVVIAQGVENTAADGSTAGTFAYIASSNSALLTYSAPNPSLFSPTGGLIFEFNDPNSGIRTFRRPEELESDRVELNDDFDMKVVSSVLGAFWTTAAT